MAVFAPGPIRIAGLEPPLDLVPPVPAGPSGPDDPVRVTSRLWAEAVRSIRRVTWIACNVRDNDGYLIDGVTGDRLPAATQGPIPDEAIENRRWERVRCAADPLYEAAIWRAVHERRAGSGRVLGWQPAIPYPFQARYVRWLEWLKAEYARNPDDPADGVVSKPRTMGVTWWTMLTLLHWWEREDGFGAILVSKDADEVDSRKVGALMARATTQYDHLRGQPAGNRIATPRWLWPRGLDPNVHKIDMIFTNPANGNEFIGEASNAKKVGRADRQTIGFVDEAAYIDRLRQALTGLTATVGFRVAASSENAEANPDFGEIVNDLAADHDPHLFELDYWQHPLYDEAWRPREEERYRRNNDADGFAREILRDRDAGLSKWAYPEARDDAGFVRVGDFPYQPGVPLDGAIDPGKDDECAVGLWQTELGGSRERLIDATADEGYEPEWWASVIVGYEDPAYRYTPEALRFMEVVRAMAPMRHLAGDPYGMHVQTAPEHAWYPKMYAYWSAQAGAIRAVRGPKWRAPEILYRYARVDNRHPGRRAALRRLIRVDGLDVNNVPQALQTLKALRLSKWRPATGRTTEQGEMPHDEWSHRRSMCEYRAVNRERLSAPLPSGPYDAATGRPLSEAAD